MEAIQLGIIKENINDEEIKRLAGQLLQKYISNNKQISEKLMVYLLGSDNQIEQAATKNYITLLLSENRLKSQLNILNNFAIQRIYECAVNIPMQINIINLIEERMAQLGINFEPFHPHYEPPQQIDPPVTVNNNQPNNSRKDHVAVSLLQTTQNPTQKGDINKEKGNIIPRIKNQENRGADKIANLEENNIVVNKTVYYFLIIFLIIFAALDIALLINYYELIKVIQTMPIGN